MNKDFNRFFVNRQLHNELQRLVKRVDELEKKIIELEKEKIKIEPLPKKESNEDIRDFHLLMESYNEYDIPHFNSP